MQYPNARFFRDNFPWLAAGMLMAFSSSYGQTYFISIFAGEIRAEFGLSHAGWGTIYSAGTLISAVLMIVLGGLIDRMRVRSLGAAILVLLAGACLAMASVPAAWALVPVILGLRFAGQGMCSHIATTAMARWFVASRGRALATATMGFALGESILPIAFVAALRVTDWRTLWVVAACLALAAIPVLFLLLRRERTPQSMGDAHQSPGLQGRHWTRAEVIRHPLFWCSVPLIIGPAAFITALFFQQVHLAERKGWSHVEFVSLFPLYTAVTIAAMIASGVLIDRFGTARLMRVFQFPMMAGFVLMGLGQGIWAGAGAMALIALSHGANTTLPTAFWADYFGTRHLGAIRALAAAIMVFGTALGPILTGWLIDAGIPFDQQMPVIALYFVATSLLISVGLAASGDPTSVREV
ncbi:MAG: MFS transporter [Rhodobacteraceae bacterium]|nr:MFS transporter [Paracoccaceae bacterium]